MIGWIRMCDAWLMRKSQDAYLWIYDWTGIYAAVVTYSMTMAFVQFVGGGISFLGMLVLTVWFIPESWRFMAQKAGNFTVFNLKAREWQSNPIRWINTGMFLGFLLGDLIFLRIASAVGDTLALVVGYLLTVQIRKREPREFKIGVGRMAAMQGIGS